MLPCRIGRALKSAAPALAAASLVIAGASIAAAAPAGVPPPCDEGAQTSGSPGETLPCVETTPPPTVTATTTVEEPQPETSPEIEPVTPAAPPVVTATTRSIRRPASPRTTTASKPTPATTTATAGPSSGGSTLRNDAAVAQVPNNGTPTLSGGPYVFPVIGAASFGDTWGAARATVAWHHGVDIFAPLGSPVVAVADGVLFLVGWNKIGGWRLWLRDREGNFFYYAHLVAFAGLAADGARVRAGTVIGFVGNTGDAAGTPYHLHFEIHPRSLLSVGYDGAVDPFSYVSAWQRSAAAADSHASRAAPTPGAILIAYTDISTADGLSAASLEQTLEEPLVADVRVAQRQPPAAPSSAREPIPPPREDDARIARSLDSELARPTRYTANVWDALSVCESGGDWTANTGNGFVGGLQFLPQTWNAHGGSAFAASPNLATREQQIAIAQRVLDSQGWGAWPACSARLGLRGQ